MSEAGRRAILKRATESPELVAEISPVIAAGFGVLPLRRLGDSLTVACFSHSNRRALRLLRDVLGLEIVATPFDERLLHEALRDAYFSERESVNLPTFLRSDFLEDPRSVRALSVEKVEQIPTGSQALPPGSVLLGDLTYRSVLTNLDRHTSGTGLPDPSRLRLVLGELELGWKPEGDTPRLCGELAPDVVMLLNEYRFTEYRRGVGSTQVSEHLIRVSRVCDLPHVLHATEVQVIGIEADGALQCHVYDRVVRVPVGEPARLEVSYHFLSYGNRMRRRIELDVHRLTVAAGERLEQAQDSGWGPRETRRWLDLK